jgi:hypothetical protein
MRFLYERKQGVKTKGRKPLSVALWKKEANGGGRRGTEEG